MYRGFGRASRLANLIYSRGSSFDLPAPRSLWSDCFVDASFESPVISRWVFSTSSRSFCAAATQGAGDDAYGENWETLENIKKREALKAKFRVLVEWGMKPDELRKVVKGTDTIYESETDNVEPKLHWLVNEYGFDKSQVLKIVQIYPPFFGRSLEDEVAPFLDVFVREGYTVGAVKKMIKEAPWILGLSSRFEPAMEFFKEEIGLDRKRFVRLVVKNPALLRYSIDDNLRPKIEFFKDLGLHKEDLVTMVRDSPKCLRYSLENNIKPNLDKLGTLGFAKKEIVAVVKKCPQGVARDFEKIIKPKFDMLENEVGMGRKAAIKYMMTKPADFLANIETWRSSFKWFLNNYESVDNEEAMEYLRKNPTILSYKAEGLEEKLEFAKRVLRAEPPAVFECPRYLVASFERTIMFRVAYLHSKLFDYQVPLRHLVSQRKRFGESFPGMAFDVEEFERAFKSWDALSREEKDDVMKSGMYPWVAKSQLDMH